MREDTRRTASKGTHCYSLEELLDAINERFGRRCASLHGQLQLVTGTPRSRRHCVVGGGAHVGSVVCDDEGVDVSERVDGLLKLHERVRGSRW